MNLDTKLTKLKSQIKIESEGVSLDLENFIREHMEKLEREGPILGLSGGLDSAVIAALCQRAAWFRKNPGSNHAR